MNHYKKPIQERSPVEIIIHVVKCICKVYLSSEKQPKDIPNNIAQLAKSVKIDTNNVAVSSILSRKGKFSNKAKEVNTHLQDICSTNNLPLIIHSNINPHRRTNVKRLHLGRYGDKQLTKNFVNFTGNS